MTSRSAVLRQMLVATTLLVAAASARAEDEIPAPPWADEYFARQDTRQYLLDAEAYLKDHSDSPYAPNVAFEAMMVASVDERTEPFDAMRRRLLFDYPKSLQASYVLSTFDAEKYAEFLQSDLSLDVLRDPVATERRLEGISTASRKWGDEIFQDDDVLLKVAIVAQRHDDYRLTTTCEKSLVEKKGNVAEVAAIVFERGAAIPAKLARLAARKDDDRQALLARQLLFMSLTAEEQRDPETLRIGMADLIRASEWSDVLTAADEYLALSPDDCRVRYWRAWALCCLDRRLEALDAARELQQKFPDDPWAQAIAPMIEGLNAPEATLDGVMALKEYVLQREGDIRGVEAWLEVHHEGHEFNGYVAGNAKGKYVEAIVQIDKSVVFAYRMSDQGVALYLAGDPAIQLADTGAFPALKVKVDEATRHISSNLGIASKDKEIMAAVNDAAGELAKLVRDRDMVESIVARLQASGSLLLPIQISPSEVAIQVATPCLSEPIDGITKIQILADQEKYRTEFEKAGELSLRVYVPTTEDYEFTPPSWPDLPKTKCAKLEASTLIRGLAVVLKAYEQAWPTSQSADVKAAALPTPSLEFE